MKLSVTDLAANLEAECFDDTASRAITFTQGKRNMTVAKQFLYFYRSYTPRYTSKEDFYDAFALILKEQYHIILRINQLQDKLDRLISPDSYRSLSNTTGTTESEGQGTEHTTNESKYKHDRYSIDTVENVTTNKTLDVSKSGDTQTSKLYDVEKE